uniref:Alpha/beta hydrolase fold-3 domain-containing protein n=1 Tax=Fagus sylvatica TaxID=28930 RepID=A0A2N9F7G0_FAGSY
MFGIQWVLPAKVLDMLAGWHNWFGRRSSAVWNLAPLCVMWSLWKERNRRIFEDLEKPFSHLQEQFSGLLFYCSRCVLLGVSCGANIADYVARKAVEAGKLLDPVKVVAQVLMYPFFIGSVPTHSELKLANSYFYDKAMCIFAWKLFLPEDEFSLDHPAANPLIPGRGPPLKLMPPTLTIVAEHDWMRDRAIAYSEELRKVNVDAPVLDYKDAVHEFATLDMLLKTPQAQACAEDIAIWLEDEQEINTLLPLPGD